jgi:N-acetylmuramic acid 6-phosphate etherase
MAGRPECRKGLWGEQRERAGSEPGVTDVWDPRLTEARNPRTEAIDRAAASTIVELMQREDRAVSPAVESQAGAIAALIERVAGCLRVGGRLIYVGAGTSGRLGVLDAAECPPTFGTEPETVQGVIAGGPEAVFRSREGVEDDRDAGRAAIERLEVGRTDFVLGIATSGTTPFVHAALEEAVSRGAGVGFLSCTPPPESMRNLAEILVTPLVGPEVIAGSTRLKAGTATKLVVNTLTTGVMIRLGKVYGNLMVDLRAVSLKLVDRGIRILAHLCAVDRGEARALLRDAGGSVKTALAMQKLEVNRAFAERLLDTVDGFLGEALERYSKPPRPYYAGYPESFSATDAHRVLVTLADSPAEIADACRQASEAGSSHSVNPSRWTASQHVAHLLEFETGAIQPRIETLLEREEPVLADFPPAPKPPGGTRPVLELLEEFTRARTSTVEALGDADAEVLTRRADLAGERVCLYQFLRGVRHHDMAHAQRIEERVHPALFESEALPPNARAF